MSLFAEAWKAVTDKVQDARLNGRMKQLSYSGRCGWPVCMQQKAELAL